MTLNAEVPFDTFSKELGLFGVSFGSIVTKFKCRIATGAFWFKKFVILRHDFFGTDPKLIELNQAMCEVKAGIFA